MNASWLFELLLAIGSVVVDRQLELEQEKEANGIFANQFQQFTRNNQSSRTSGSSGNFRQARMPAVPPGAPITIGQYKAIATVHFQCAPYRQSVTAPNFDASCQNK